MRLHPVSSETITSCTDYCTRRVLGITKEEFFNNYNVTELYIEDISKYLFCKGDIIMLKMKRHFSEPRTTINEEGIVTKLRIGEQLQKDIEKVHTFVIEANPNNETLETASSQILTSDFYNLLIQTGEPSLILYPWENEFYTIDFYLLTYTKKNDNNIL